jgi:hypothetical protein
VFFHCAEREKLTSAPSEGPYKFEFSFLNVNLMVPADHQIIFAWEVTTPREPGSMTLE